MVAILFLVGMELEQPQVITHMLDVEKTPGKPQYGMASGQYGMASWVIVHGFRPKSEKFDFGKKGYHRKEHLKRSRMAQISAP